jgi:hypothetical protein
MISNKNELAKNEYESIDIQALEEICENRADR